MFFLFRHLYLAIEVVLNYPAEVVLNYRDDNLFTEVDKFPLAQDIVNCKNYAGCNRLTMLEL